MSFQIVHNDITNMKTDAIVNAANERLMAGGGVCGAIFGKAGYDRLQAACHKKAPCATGQAVITEGFDLPAKYIIHAVGPVWRGGGHDEEKFLSGAYTSALMLAKEYGCESIAFPLISSGIYGYPKAEALAVAVSAFRQFLRENEMDIYLVVFDRKAVTLSEGLFDRISHYVDMYFDEEDDRRSRLWETVTFGKEPQQPFACAEALPVVKERSLEDLLENMDETFTEMIFRLISEKGYTDAQVYKRANLDRKLFSKIRSNADYRPKKNTVLALAVGLQLSVDEATDLLMRAGYCFSNSSKLDVIVRFFLEQEEWDIDLINEALFCFDQPVLGSAM